MKLLSFKLLLFKFIEKVLSLLSSEVTTISVEEFKFFKK